jgi:hypothetical protein
MLSSHKSHAQIHKPSTTDSYNCCTIMRNSSSSSSELLTHEWLHNHTWKFTIAADKCFWRPKSCLKKKNSQAASFAASRLAPMTHSFYYLSYPFANTKSFHSKLLVHNAVLHQKILNRVLRHDSKSSKELTWVSLFLSILRDHNKMLTTHSTKKIMLKKNRRKACEHHQEQQQQQ